MLDAGNKESTGPLLPWREEAAGGIIAVNVLGAKAMHSIGREPIAGFLREQNSSHHLASGHIPEVPICYACFDMETASTHLIFRYLYCVYDIYIYYNILHIIFEAWACTSLP